MTTHTISLIPQDAVIFNHNQVRTNSLKVAEAFRKRHDNVIRNIQGIQCSPEFNALNFEVVEYLDKKGEKRTMWEMTKDGFMFIVMSFTGKKAAAIKEAYINAFNAMAEQLTKPKTTALSELPITPAQLYHLKTAARTLAERSGETVLDVYEDVMRVFGVNDLREITADYYPQVCAMLQTDALEGEWLRGQMPPLPKAPRYHYPKLSAKPYSNSLPNQSWFTSSVLLDPDNPRPLNELLNQLTKDGHNVEGARLEYIAARERLNDLYSSAYHALDTLKNALQRGLNVTW